jgi:hypothetical protein
MKLLQILHILDELFNTACKLSLDTLPQKLSGDPSRFAVIE